MSAGTPPKKNAIYTFYISLVSQADTKLFQSNPTIAAGDFKVSTDGGAEGNPGTLPAVTPASGKGVKVTLSASEMNGDDVHLIGSDAAGAEWCDIFIHLKPSARQIDDLMYPTVTGRSTDVTAGGAVGIDLANVENQGTTLNLSATTINLCNTVTTLTGHTVQTGDSFARIGAAGAGLTAINLPDQTMNITGNITGNLSGSVGSVTGAVGSVTGAVGSVTGAVGSVAGNVDGNVTGSVGSVVGHTVQTGDSFARIGAGGASLGDLGGMSSGMKAEVNAEAKDVMNVDTLTLPGQVAPPLAPTPFEVLTWIYKTFRNKKDQDSGTWQLFDDAGTTVDSKATVSDIAGLMTKEEIAAGP